MTVAIACAFAGMAVWLFVCIRNWRVEDRVAKRLDAALRWVALDAGRAVTECKTCSARWEAMALVATEAALEFQDYMDGGDPTRTGGASSLKNAIAAVEGENESQRAQHE